MEITLNTTHSCDNLSGTEIFKHEGSLKEAICMKNKQNVDFDCLVSIIFF